MNRIWRLGLGSAVLTGAVLPLAAGCVDGGIDAARGGGQGTTATVDGIGDRDSPTTSRAKKRGAAIWDSAAASRARTIEAAKLPRLE